MSAGVVQLLVVAAATVLVMVVSAPGFPGLRR